MRRYTTKRYEDTRLTTTIRPTLTTTIKNIQTHKNNLKGYKHKRGQRLTNTYIQYLTSFHFEIFFSKFPLKTAAA